MQTKEERRNEILQRHIDEKRESGVPYTKEAVAEAVYSVMDAWAKPAVDALRKIQDFYIPTIQRMEDSSYTGSASEALSKIISEALKQYNQ